jgi:type IV pilus assembly protein PilY1
MLARISATGLSQYALMTTGSSGSVNQRTQATAASLVNYLRGQSQNEGYLAGTSGKLYRTRSAALGDIVGSKSQYVAAPYRDYLDAGYASFKAAQSARTPMVYVGGNDGMLHAFYAPAATATGATLATAGTEAWAYIPTIVIDNLSKLADINYKSNHRFFVDGTPLVSDVKFSDGEWHTILVGGLNKGGKGFYALDVTDPAAPVSLWEFDSSNCSPGGCSVGYSFGVPVIGKLANGTWAVFLTSGYNNSTGQATLFVLNAQSGASIKSMNAGSGSASDPSGLAKISAWSNYPGVDDTVQNVYGGDLQGNIWRFDVNSDSATTAVLLGVAKDSAGARQSITTAPEVGLVKGKRYVFVGTGRLLGVGDLDRTQTQSVYGLYDSLVTTDNTTALRSVLKGLRTTSDYTIECSPDSATSCKDVNEKGYVIDLVGANEQIILPLTLIGSTLTIVSNQPKEGSCGSGSKSSVYFAKGNDGSTVEAGLGLPVGAVGVTYVNGEEQTVIGYPRTDPLAPPIDPFVVPSGISPLVGANRASWRGIMQQQ